MKMFDLLFPAVRGSIMPFSPLIFPAISMGLGLIGGLGTSDKAKQSRQFMDDIDAMIPGLGETAFGKDELLGIGREQSRKMETAGDLAVADLAPSISESSAVGGMGRGQDASSLFMSAIAPIKAQGIQMGQQNLTQILSMFSNMDAQAKQRVLQAMGLKGGAIGGLEETSPEQGGILGAFAGLDIGTDFLGNYLTFLENQKLPGEE